MSVKVWEEEIIIPTYEIGEAEKNPMFLEKRVYQGSSGSVYPYPVVEKIEDTAVDKSYQAVYLENEYIKVMILPELGGRIQMAYDKIKQRHFIYYNNVIKPALVGLTGPWISGGIEFNWPQHHRPSTYLPVDYTIEQLADGGATVWVCERERMFHQYGSAGFTLRPDKAVIEIKGKVYNPTPIPQTFLWWANPAVAVNDDYQSVFPADVKAVFDHGKRDVASFPIATGTYYKVDYSAGVDISMYKNLPVPTSYMADKSKYDFVGGYENDTKAGLLHVASHHVSPGKKQWTWGNGDFGTAWDRNLTDKDGPYIELMTGVYTDNQPDFTWLQPYEEKTFTQYFMPYRELGIVKNASKDLLLNIEQTTEKKALVKVFATSKQENIKVVLKEGDKLIFEKTCHLSPKVVFEEEVDIDGIHFDKIEISILASNGKVLLSWTKNDIEDFEMPEAAPAAKDIQDIETNEDLYLTGLHLEQYRHATYDPTTYYKEALKRDPKDIRNNNALGLWLIRHGQCAEAEQYLRAAIKRQMELTPNPYDGEPLYNLGLSLKFQNKLDDAYDNFHKACWNGAWQDSGYYALAQISAIKGEFEQALTEIDKSLFRNWNNLVGRSFKIAILNRLERKEEAIALIDDSLKIDKFNFGALFLRYMITGSGKENLIHIMRCESHNYCELAIDYVGAGLYTEAIAVLDLGMDVCAEISPMLYYYKGYAQSLSGDQESAKSTFSQANQANPNGCFPNALEAIKALQTAIKVNPKESKAYYYLGDLWYDKRQYKEAICCWEISKEMDNQFPTVLRNLALAYFNKYNKQEEAVDLLEKAFALDTKDARILMELDQLYKRINKPHQGRLNFLIAHKEVVYTRDDLYLEYVTLLNQTEKYAEAIERIENRIFHPWEGGEGKVPEQYQIARIDLAKECLQEQKYTEAIKLLEECFLYPHHMGEGKLCNAQENDIHYFLGCAYKGLNEGEKATHYYELAAEGLDEPSDAMYYNDQKPDKIFYKGLALVALDKTGEAEKVFQKLITYSDTHYNDQIKIDYFAVSLPDLLIWEDDLNKRNQIHCSYIKGLGLMGLGKNYESQMALQKSLDMNINHQGVQRHLAKCKV